MKKSARFALISVAVVFVALVGFTLITGVGLTEEYKRKEAESEDVEAFRNKVDKTFEKMAEDIMYYSKESERADSHDEEYKAVVRITESISDGMRELDKYGPLDRPDNPTPAIYRDDIHEVTNRLLEVYSVCSDYLKLYEEEEYEKAYDQVQTIIDKFSKAQDMKNKMFGYE